MLANIWRDLRTHRRVVLLLLGLWIAFVVLGITFKGLVDAGWFGEAGWSEIVWNLSAPGLFLLPLLGSFLVGWWRNRPAARPEEGRIADSLLGGGLIMLVNLLVVAALGLISDLLSGAAFQFSWDAVMLITIVFAVPGFVLGAVAGLIGTSLAAIWRHWHGGGGPAVHTGTP
jgi:hypothetical protein